MSLIFNFSKGKLGRWLRALFGRRGLAVEIPAAEALNSVAAQYLAMPTN